MKTSKKQKHYLVCQNRKAVKKGPSYKVAKWTLPNAKLKKRKRKTI